MSSSWLVVTPVMLATQETETGEDCVQGQPGQKVQQKNCVQ
jgi:hypothetical protein